MHSAPNNPQSAIDMLAMLFDNAYDALSFVAPSHREPSERE
jgi:hypothetical protein